MLTIILNFVIIRLLNQKVIGIKMLKNQWENILQDKDTRQSLSKIRQAIKDPTALQQLHNIADGNEEILIKLLQSQDAKTRKNAALLMGDLENNIFLAPIWQAYQNELQRFVKSSYLSAIGKFNYDIYLDDIKEQLEFLKTVELTTENEKHITEEIRELSALIVQGEGIIFHSFTGWNNPCHVMLIANRNITEIVSKELLDLEPSAKIKPVNVGVMASVGNLNWLKDIRIYQEVLFLIPGMAACEMDETAIADTIAASGLLDFLSSSHNGKAPYHFRLEMKSKKSLGEKSTFLKKLASGIEKLSNRRLINSTGIYEFEIRLIENKQQRCNIMIKLFTIQDGRFTYRKEFIPTSIKPVNAALTVAVAKEFMKPQAQVMDPFCGVGTMLIERHKAVPANTTYGIDVQEEAIIKARENTQTAGQIIHYINRDFFTFTHEYLFDEVITDMPFQIGRITQDEVFDIYQQFFHKLPQHLKEGAVIILYSHNKDYVKQMTARTDFKMLKEVLISKREETYVLILQYR